MLPSTESPNDLLLHKYTGNTQIELPHVFGFAVASALARLSIAVIICDLLVQVKL